MWIPTVPKAMTKILPLTFMNKGPKGGWIELQLKWFTLGEVQGGDRLNFQFISPNKTHCYSHP